jgi:hypothetical protein
MFLEYRVKLNKCFNLIKDLKLQKASKLLKISTLPHAIYDGVPLGKNLNH